MQNRRNKYWNRKSKCFYVNNVERFMLALKSNPDYMKPTHINENRKNNENAKPGKSHELNFTPIK